MDLEDQVGGIAGWYSNPNQMSSSEELLRSTFVHAKLLLQSTISSQDFNELFPPTDEPNAQRVSNQSLFDVQWHLRNAQNSYECRTQRTTDVFQTIAPNTAVPPPIKPITPFGKSKAKARLWLMGLSEKIVYYANVFDVMAQHHPEYVSLAWGTFKLLFIAITNHAETASKLSESISRIADLLPQHSLHLILYPTPQMQTSVSRLYAQILNFFLNSLRWYKESRAMHALKSILQPWDLKFRQEYEAIASEAQQIRRLADIAMKAEVRDTRLEVEQSTRHLDLVRHEITQLREENQRLHGLFRSKFETIESSVICMYQELRFDFSTQRATLNRVHLNQMLSLPLWNSLPTSGESLQFCRSIRNRRRERTKLPLPEVKKLEAWTSQKNKAILLIDTYASNTAKAFMVDLIDLILENGMPIIWALRYPDYWNQRTSIADIIRMLVLQAMQLGANRLLDSTFPVTVEQLREAATPNDWIAILKRLLSATSHAFIILDPDLLSHATVHERSLALEMMDMLQSELSGIVKIVIATSSVGRDYTEQLESFDTCVKIQTGKSDFRRPRRQMRLGERFRRHYAS